LSQFFEEWRGGNIEKSAPMIGRGSQRDSRKAISSIRRASWPTFAAEGSYERQLLVEDPFRLGYDSVKTVLSASKGEQVAANINVEATLVTKANMSSARSQELLNPEAK
jgi:hypothetical protein